LGGLGIFASSYFLARLQMANLALNLALPSVTRRCPIKPRRAG